MDRITNAVHNRERIFLKLPVGVSEYAQPPGVDVAAAKQKLNLGNLDRIDSSTDEHPARSPAGSIKIISDSLHFDVHRAVDIPTEPVCPRQ